MFVEEIREMIAVLDKSRKTPCGFHFVLRVSLESFTRKFDF
jgi:hypothetical protein